VIVTGIELDPDVVARRKLIAPPEAGRDLCRVSVIAHHRDVQESIVVGNLDACHLGHRAAVVGIALEEVAGGFCERPRFVGQASVDDRRLSRDTQGMDDLALLQMACRLGWRVFKRDLGKRGHTRHPEDGRQAKREMNAARAARHRRQGSRHPSRAKSSGEPIPPAITYDVEMLQAVGLRKTFGPLVAVDDVSFRIESGTVLGLLGPNGAGKTTTVSMIAGLITPDSGEVLVDGRTLSGDRDPLKRKIGLVPQDLALYEELSALQNLRFFGALYGLTGAELERAIQRVLDLVGLADRARDAVKVFSGGMKRRMNLAAGLLHDPDILLLDEPTVGVDPQSRNAIFDNLEQLTKAGKALLYTTHYMEEAERLADRIVVMDRGRVLADDTLEGLLRRVPAAASADGRVSLESVFLTLTGRSLRD
jgi:ABC-2 type transport system ATP-binding protein